MIVCILGMVMTVGWCIYKKMHRDMPYQSLQMVQSDHLVAPAIIDAQQDITHVAALQSGVIRRIDVKVGELVKKGQPLFSMDDKIIKNERRMNQLNLKKMVHETMMQRQHLHHLRQQLVRLKSLDQRAVSQSELQEKAHEIEMALAQWMQAKYNLKLTKANLRHTELIRKQYTVTAPKAGIVLQVNAHRNEFVGVGKEIVFLGDAKKIIVRISIDERDIARFQPENPVSIINYSNSALNIPLHFIQRDQYIITQERLNSRVLEALYYIKRAEHADLVAGQLFDALITVKNT
jgi:multidrug efflux pump subunit AcrA (membrane-fusion protein)